MILDVAASNILQHPITSYNYPPRGANLGLRWLELMQQLVPNCVMPPFWCLMSHPLDGASRAEVSTVNSKALGRCDFPLKLFRCPRQVVDRGQRQAVWETRHDFLGIAKDAKASSNALASRTKQIHVSCNLSIHHGRRPARPVLSGSRRTIFPWRFRPSTETWRWDRSIFGSTCRVLLSCDFVTYTQRWEEPTNNQP